MSDTAPGPAAISQITASTAQSPARIAIDGAQSTGKTTLFRDLENAYGSQLVAIPEASRVVAPAFGVMTAADWPTLLTDRDRLRSFFEAEETWQVAQQAGHPRFLIDSSLLLTAAYRAAFEVADERWCAEPYDLILFCSMAAGDGCDDGFRFLNGREKVEDTYLHLVRKHHRGAFVRLPFGPQRGTIARNAVERVLRGN